MRVAKCGFVFLILFFLQSVFSQVQKKTGKDFLLLLQDGSARKISKALFQNKNWNLAAFGREKNSPLMVAIQLGRKVDVINALLASGISVDYENENGDTALIFAGKYKADTKVVKKLVCYNANLDEKIRRANKRNKLGQNVFDFFSYGTKQHDFLKKYRAKNEELVLPKNARGEISSEWQIQQNENLSKKIPNDEIENLPKEFADAKISEDDFFQDEIANKDDENFFETKEFQTQKKRKHLFSDYEDFVESENLPKQKIKNPNVRDKNGLAPIHKAAAEDDLETLSALLHSGADVDLFDWDSWTALMYAARYAKKSETIAILKNAGARADVKTQTGASLLEMAACYNTNAQIVSEIADIASEKDLQAAFVSAISMGREKEIISVFLRHGISANMFYKGKTPLMYAAQSNMNTDCIEFLLEIGADKTFVTADGCDAFYFAKKNPNLPRNDIFWSLDNSKNFWSE